MYYKCLILHHTGRKLSSRHISKWQAQIWSFFITGIKGHSHRAKAEAKFFFDICRFFFFTFAPPLSLGLNEPLQGWSFLLPYFRPTLSFSLSVIWISAFTKFCIKRFMKMINFFYQLILFDLFSKSYVPAKNVFYILVNNVNTSFFHVHNRFHYLGTLTGK